MINFEYILNFLTLTSLEIILGVDNIIFIALLVQPIDINLRNKIRMYGISLALILRIIMLFGATQIAKMTKPIIKIIDFSFSGRDLLLIFGGLFLIIKAFNELKDLISHQKIKHNNIEVKSKLWKIIGQIILIDVILSFDSIITAVGIAPNNIEIIILAIVISMLIMLWSADYISDFIYQNPNVKIVALSFIGLIGIFLLSSGFGIEISKAYLYFAVGFSALNETLKIISHNKKSLSDQK